MDSSETRPYDADNRRHKSLSLAIRSQVEKRRSFVRPSSPSPTCKERVHYPVFNPQDPRHNPPSNSPPRDQDDYYMAQTSNARDSVRWMQSLPRKSLHKARSGFLALRSGMQRTPQARSRNGGNNIPSVWSSSEDSSSQQEDDFPSTVSEASTEEDFDFGTGLYRAPCNCSSALVGEPERYLLRAHRSSITLAGPGCLSHLHMECCSSVNSSSETLNSSDVDVDREPRESSRGASSQLPRGDILSKTSSCGGTSTSNSTSDSSSPPSDNAPRLGVSQSTEPLRVSHQSRASSIPCESSRRASAEIEPARPTEPVNLIDRAYSREERASEAAPDNALEGDADVETNTDVMSRLSYRLDLLEALESPRSSPREDSEAADTSARQSMQSNSHSEGETETPPTSISNHIRSSTDTNTDGDADLASLASMRDEYFLEDKSNHPRHDGREAVKREGQSLCSQGRNSIPCSLRFDDTSSVPTRHPSVCEIPPPVGVGLPEIRISPAEDVASPGEDESDEHLAAYSLWQRHYFG